MQELTACRICKADTFQTILDFGTHAQAGYFPKVGEEAPRLPLRAVRCQSCSLTQLGHRFDSGLLYGSHYGYRSGLNLSMVEHLSDIVRKEVPRWVGELGHDDAVLDIGSSDGALLGYYRPEIRRVGIDPCLESMRQFYQPGIEAIAGFFGQVPLAGPFKVVTSIAMFYDLEDPVMFAFQVKDLLANDGVWILEQAYWPHLVGVGAYDVICHEHLLYYSLTDIKRIMDAVGLVIRAVSFNASNGASFRVVVSKAGSACNVQPLLEAEQRLDLESFVTFVKRHGEALRGLLCDLKRDGNVIHGYGASTKGNTVLQHARIGPDLLTCMLEVSESKRGCWTPGTHIPIVLQAPEPNYYLVMPWHFRSSIVRREKEYLARGGHLIFPLPQIEVV